MKPSRLIQGLFLITLLSVVAAGCASGPALKSYPITQIDRPYTLPKGVATWQIPAIYDFGRRNNGETINLYPIPVPLYWQSSLSDDWQLNWAPLPLSISHQFKYDETGYLGTSLSVGGGYGSVQGVFLAPLLAFDYLQKLTPTLGILNHLDGSLLKSFSGTPASWVVKYSPEAFIQLSPTFAILTGPEFNFSDTRQDTFYQYGDTSYYQPIFQFRLPLVATIRWSLGRQWDFDASYHASYIGEKIGTYENSGYFTFTHFW